ncbi:hypothetical protein ACFYON_12990 [Micromonospora sp. NPDC005686]|uniref:hypothetical protein n=1 Tax=Micromonospora sp. NPDC005686 TaxID=3364233 RepID=UPI0036B90B0C
MRVACDAAVVDCDVGAVPRHGERNVNETTAREADSAPAGRTRPPGRRLRIAVPVLVLLLAGAAGFVLWGERGAEPGCPPAPIGARGEPGEYQSVPTAAVPTASGPAQVFAGTTAEEVTDAWVRRWPGPVTMDRSLRIINVTLPGTRDELSAAVVPPTKDRRDEVGHVICRVKLQGSLSRSLLRTLVDGCLGPVLKTDERAAVRDWLTGVDLSPPHFQMKRSPRFELQVNRNAEPNLMLTLNAR